MPATTEPTGQPSPFDSAIETRSNGAASTAGSSPRATAALSSRAPSRYAANPVLVRRVADLSQHRGVPHQPALAVLRVLDLDQRVGG